jgi:hypothetical protein
VREKSMNEPRTPVDADATIPLQLRRRVKRGIVASYIHEISERHNGADAHAQDVAAAPAEPIEES